MNLSDIITKCYILALIIRDDGERLLLGDGIYEFKSSLQHFAPNICQNDIVELQGADGQLLAGQVRRSATQAFDGYIADGTIAKTTTEQSRRRFLAFFRKKHHYKVVYIMPDGTAVKRDRGYIVDAPAVQELYQLFPEYHIGLNFEDPNYYEYEEDSEGDEIYAHIQAIAITRELQAGLVWDALGAVSDDIAWNEYTTKNTINGYAQITDAIATAPLSLTHLYGSAEQKTLSGKNLQTPTPYRTGSRYYSGTAGADMSPATSTYVTTSVSGDKVSIICTATWVAAMFLVEVTEGQTYHMHFHQKGTGARSTTYTLDSSYAVVRNTGNAASDDYTRDGNITVASGEKYIAIAIGCGNPATTITVEQLQVELGSTYTGWQEYCGGIPSPSPDYPQDIKTVTGAQTVKITGKNLFDQSADEQGSFNYITGILGNNNNRIRTLPIECFPNTEYTISANQSLGEWAVIYYAEDGTFIRGEGQDNITTTSKTWTSKPNAKYMRIRLGSDSYPMTAGADYNIMLSADSTPQTYEPYQGQSQEINLGKNLIPTPYNPTFPYTANGVTFTLNSDNSISINGTATANTDLTLTSTTGTIAKVPNGTYTFSVSGLSSGVTAITSGGGNNGFPYTTLTNSSPSSTGAVTDGSKPFNYFIIRVASGTTCTNQRVAIQLEAGTQATPYAPYKTPIELAKIGTYQDYIWNDDGIWKVHKEVGKATVSLGTTVYTLANGLKGTTYAPANKYYGEGGALCNKASYRSQQTGGFYENPSNFMFVGTSTDDSASLKAKYDGADLYYVLATPTDTEITDSELIEQLNHIYSLYQGQNNLWLIPNAGAQGEMTVRYAIGYSDIGSGYHWNEEQGASSNIVTNDGIDSVRPLWIINGPATNPTLTNSTTGQTITWNGTVPAGATLTIDMDRQTAALNGANVFAQLEGDWIELAVGPNKLQYSASGGATADSTIEWNGVIG